MSELLIERDRPGILLLRLNRPERRNALSTSLLTEIADALDAAGPSIRCAVITGNEKVFAAGADIQEIADKDEAGALADPAMIRIG